MAPSVSAGKDGTEKSHGNSEGEADGGASTKDSGKVEGNTAVSVGNKDDNNTDQNTSNASKIEQTNENESTDEEANSEETTAEGEAKESNEPYRALYKSPRVKGYLTIAFASIIQFSEALISNDPLDTRVVPASMRQKRYATGVSITSASIACILVLIHFDQHSPLRKFWYKLFSPKSTFEWYIIAFLILWWLPATVVQTTVRGIAGDGKGQYNIYYSTWLSMWASFYCMDKKLIDHGFPGFQSFISSWPFRAPGWIAIFVSCFFSLFWYLDVFLNSSRDSSNLTSTVDLFYTEISDGQYRTSLILAVFTLLPSAVFVFVEIFRETAIQHKSNLETVLEGFFLFLLVISWVPAVISTTTPGGFASLVGNSYFFTWGTTALVMETFLWFVHDCRATVHSDMQEKEREYRRHQEQVLQHTNRIAERHEDESVIASSNANNHTSHGDSNESIMGIRSHRPLNRRLYDDCDNFIAEMPTRDRGELDTQQGAGDTENRRPSLAVSDAEFFDAQQEFVDP